MTGHPETIHSVDATQIHTTSATAVGGYDSSDRMRENLFGEMLQRLS